MKELTCGWISTPWGPINRDDTCISAGYGAPDSRMAQQQVVSAALASRRSRSVLDNFVPSVLAVMTKNQIHASAMTTSNQSGNRKMPNGASTIASAFP